MQIIENFETAGSRYVLEFKVYESRLMRGEVLGYLVPFRITDGEESRWLKSEFGQSVGEGFARTLKLAEDYGAEAVWVNDPKGLFPPDARGRA